VADEGTGVPEGLLEIGRVAKPHGIRGEVVVQAVTNRHERFVPGACHRSPRGDLVVAAARRHQGRWIVAYEGISERTDAETLRGLALWGEPLDQLDEGEWWVHDLVGSEVVDQAGTVHGRVTAVEENPAHDILVLDGGGLVPIVFVSEVAEGRVLVDVPEGLLDGTFVEANRPGVQRRPARRKQRRRATPPEGVEGHSAAGESESEGEGEGGP